MKRIFNPGDLYILLWMSVIVLGEIFSNHFTGLLSVFALVVSMYYTIFALTQYKLPKCFIYLNLLLLMFTIYGVVFMIKGEVLLVSGYRYVKNSRYLYSIYSSLLPIYAFYVLSRQGWITEKKLQFWIGVFFLVVGFQFYSENSRMEARADELGVSIEQFHNNLGYLFVALIPYVAFFYKKPTVQYVMLAIIMAMLFSGLKRGAILIGSVCMILFIVNTFKRGGGGKC